MKTLMAKEAKYGFGRLIDLARAETGGGRQAWAAGCGGVIAMGEHERLKIFEIGHLDNRPSMTGKAE